MALYPVYERPGWAPKQPQLNRQWRRRYLEHHPCVDCGEHRPRYLTFDHVRGEKRRCVAEMMWWGYSLADVQAEIEKCDVRCITCHAKRHQEAP